MFKNFDKRKNIYWYLQKKDPKITNLELQLDQTSKDWSKETEFSQPTKNAFNKTLLQMRFYKILISVTSFSKPPDLPNNLTAFI